MSNRFHSKYHRTNHHTYGSNLVFGTPTNPDSGHDPIASPEHPFKGDFVLRGGLSASVPSESAYAAAFSGNLLLTGSLIVEDDILHLDFDNKIVGINIDPIAPINYRSIGNFDFVVNKNAYFLRNITSPTISSNYIRVDINDGSINYPVEVLKTENLYSYFLIDNLGRVGINLGSNRNLQGSNLKVDGKSLFVPLENEFKIRGNTYINNDFGGFESQIQTNVGSGPLKMGRNGFTVLSSNTMQVDGQGVFLKNFYLSGNAELGRNFTQTIIANARVASNFVPNQAYVRDLGMTILPWKTLFFNTLSGGFGTFESNIQVSGNSTFGSDTNDIIVANARVASNFVPNQAYVRNLGMEILPWNTLFFNTLSGGSGTFKDNVLINNNLTVDNNTILGSATNDTIVANARVASDFVPNIAYARDLGLPTLPWRTLRFNSLSGASGIFKDNVLINRNLTVDEKTVLQDTDAKSIKINNTGSQLIALDVNQAGANTDVANFKDNGTSALIIKDGGNVGINTTTPNHKLTINGNISTTEFLYFKNQNYLFGDDSDGVESSGNFKVNASTILGTNVNSHTVNFGGSKISSDFQPSNNTVSIGTITNRWNNIYVNVLDGTNGNFETLTCTEQINDTEFNDNKVINKKSGDLIYKNFQDSILLNDTLISSSSNTSPTNFSLTYQLSSSQQQQKFFETTFVYIINSTNTTSFDTRFMIDTGNTSGIDLNTIKIIDHSSSGISIIASGNVASNIAEATYGITPGVPFYLKRTLIFKTTSSSQSFNIVPGFNVQSPAGSNFTVLKSSFATKRKMT
jgi:hypothetical protein